MYFDVDATHVEKYGHQEGVQKGYVGQAMPESCYQYLLIYFNNRKNFLYGTIRADSAYFSEAAVDLIKENDAHFFIKAAMSESRQNFVQVSPALHWSKEINGVSYAS